MAHPGGTEDLPVGCETCQILASRKGCKILMKECLVIFHLPRLYLRHVIFYFLRIWPPTCLFPREEGQGIKLVHFPRILWCEKASIFLSYRNQQPETWRKSFKTWSSKCDFIPAPLLSHHVFPLLHTTSTSPCSAENINNTDLVVPLRSS